MRPSRKASFRAAALRCFAFFFVYDAAMRFAHRFLWAAISAFAMALPVAAQTTGATGGPFVATPHSIADRMLALGRVGPGDYVMDLGSGDGRLVITAVAKYKARGAAGIEIDQGLVFVAIDNARSVGVG